MQKGSLSPRVHPQWNPGHLNPTYVSGLLYLPGYYCRRVHCHLGYAPMVPRPSKSYEGVLLWLPEYPGCQWPLQHNSVIEDWFNLTVWWVLLKLHIIIWFSKTPDLQSVATTSYVISHLHNKQTLKTLWQYCHDQSRLSTGHGIVVLV